MAPDGRVEDIHLLRGQYWLTRIVFLRCLGFVYAAAFFSALRDNGALVRSRVISISYTFYMRSTRTAVLLQGYQCRSTSTEVSA